MRTNIFLCLAAALLVQADIVVARGLLGDSEPKRAGSLLDSPEGRRAPRKLRKAVANGDVNARTGGARWTLLGYETFKGRVENMRFLLEAGADPDLANKHGTTPLRNAIFPTWAHLHNDGLPYKMTQLLLSHGADPNLKGREDGERPLMTAASLDDIRFIDLLLDAGADPRLKNNKGQTAAEFARLGGFINAASHLEKAEAEAPARAAELARAKKEKTALSALRDRIDDILTEEKAGDAARETGDHKKALSHYISAIEHAPLSAEPGRRLREKVISVAHSMKTAPAIPEEAKRHMIRGQAFLEQAKGLKEYSKAAEEIDMAARLAPWWPAAYFNLGLVREKTKDFSGAITSLEMYLLAAPKAKDTDAVRKKIYKLEVAKELAESK